MKTTQLIEIATGTITDLETIQNILDDNASHVRIKRDANDLGFLVGLNSKLFNDVNPFVKGPLAFAFDLGHAEAHFDLNEFDVGDDVDDDESTPMDRICVPICGAVHSIKRKH